MIVGITTLRRRYHGAPKVTVPERPNESAKKDEWVAYANALNIDSTGTKDEIKQRIADAETSVPAGTTDSGVTTAADLAPGAPSAPAGSDQSGDSSDQKSTGDDGDTGDKSAEVDVVATKSGDEKPVNDAKPKTKSASA